MNFSELKTFLETAKRGSLSDAARYLGITQPAVTRHIQKLERELRVQLLKRGDGPVTLTEAGKVVMTYTEQTLAEQQNLLSRLSHLQEDIRGKLTVAASSIPGEFIVPKILAEFSRLHPAVQSTVSILDTQEVITWVIEGRCDIGFVGAQTDHPQLSFTKVGDDEIVLAVYPEHPFFQRTYVKLSELAEQPFVMREQGSGTMKSLYRLLEAQGLTLPPHRVTAVLNTTRALVSAIEAGLGIGFVSTHALPDSHQEGRARPVRIEGLTLRRDLYLVYDQLHTATRLLKELLEMLKDWPPLTQPDS